MATFVILLDETEFFVPRERGLVYNRHKVVSWNAYKY